MGLRPLLLDLLRPPSAETWKALRVGIPLGLEGAFFSVIYIFLTSYLLRPANRCVPPCLSQIVLLEVA
jgi:Na+-driven multidrug efflux pump